MDAKKLENVPVKSCKNYLSNGKHATKIIKDFLLGGG